MLRLEKIYLENFKGIGSSRIVDFENADFSILNGPNGFGKTTIFDAIELCLRGKLERTVQFSNIQKNTQNYKKPFYQNTVGRDVTIKVLFRDTTTNSAHIFIKFLDKDNSGKIGNSKSFRPDAWGILETYYSDNESVFPLAFDKDVLKEYSQQQIDELFFTNAYLSHQNLYPLFNYLQQEENIYFLKKDEEEKKEELNFLFQTQQQAAELDKLNFILKGIKSSKDLLIEKVKQLGNNANEGETQTYLKLFTEKDIAYDNEEPFLDVEPGNITVVYEAYSKDLEILEEFSNTFDFREYNKDKLRESISYAIDNSNILNAFALQTLCRLENFEKLQLLDQRKSRFEKALVNIESNQYEASVLEELGFKQDFILAYDSAIKERNTQEKEIGDIGNIINDLNNARKTSIEKAAEVPEIAHPENCPLCDTSFESADVLRSVIDNKTIALTEFNKIQLNKLEELNTGIKTNFQLAVKQEIIDYFSKMENQIDPVFFNRVREFRGFDERIKRFQNVLSENRISFDTYILLLPLSISQLDEHIEKLRFEMIKILSDIVPDQEKLLHKHLYKDLFSEKSSLLVSPSEVQNKKKYIEYKFNESRMFSLNIFNARLTKFIELEAKITKIKNALDQSIKKYKMEMIEKIKIPFYLYSGKILQNYQQGLGIFIDMQGSTNRVRFLTDSESDHDIIHHLSSGQLAVVSIAFCLALNKVYETTNHFKFLAIDDPVQTLDDINIHSFIELMRHDFKDYQIIMSTHEDDIANYLTYKFDKFDFKCKRLRVQKLFYAGKEQ